MNRAVKINNNIIYRFENCCGEKEICRRHISLCNRSSCAARTRRSKTAETPNKKTALNEQGCKDKQ